MLCEEQSNLLNCKLSSFERYLCAWCLNNESYNCITYDGCNGDDLNKTRCIMLDSNLQKNLCEELTIFNYLTEYIVYLLFGLFIIGCILLSISICISLCTGKNIKILHNKCINIFSILFLLIVSTILIFEYDFNSSLPILSYILAGTILILGITYLFDNLRNHYCLHKFINHRKNNNELLLDKHKNDDITQVDRHSTL